MLLLVALNEQLDFLGVALVDFRGDLVSDELVQVLNFLEYLTLKLPSFIFALLIAETVSTDL